MNMYPAVGAAAGMWQSAVYNCCPYIKQGPTGSEGSTCKNHHTARLRTPGGFTNPLKDKHLLLGYTEWVWPKYLPIVHS